jgi:hypothetical protein
MVQRYAQDWEFASSDIIKRKDGPWVKYSDYKIVSGRMIENGLEVDRLQTENAAFKTSEKNLSDAYLRIRELLNAYDTQAGGADRFEVTERKLKELIDENAALRERLAQLVEVLKDVRTTLLTEAMLNPRYGWKEWVEERVNPAIADAKEKEVIST